MDPDLKRKRVEADIAVPLKRNKSIQKHQKSKSPFITEGCLSPNPTEELALPNDIHEKRCLTTSKSLSHLEDTLGNTESLDESMPIKSRELGSWKISPAIGGRINRCDPIFTADEKFLIVTFRTIIQVYATSDSLLHRSIPLKLDPATAALTRIVTASLSSSNPHILWVACSDGSIFSVDWTTGAGASSFWTVSSTGCLHMTVASMLSLSRRRDVIFTTENRKDGGFRTTANELADPNGPIAIAARTIYTSPEPIQFLRATSDGSVIVGVSGKRILVGQLRSTEFDTVDKIKFEFRTFESKDLVTSLDIRVSQSPQPEIPKKDRAPKIPIVDLVVGNIKGVIFVHTDLAAKLFGRLPKGAAPSINSLSPSKHHWHRQAVRSVKWSLDGNYIISGGTETTLVSWQLDTGKKEFLPHMSAMIENIVVSPRGSKYAILLSDNSAMVLSTADLLPKMNIAGVQAPVIITSSPVESEFLRAEGISYSRPLIQRIPAVVNPASHRSLLLAVGPVQEIKAANPYVTSNPFLQIFDLATNQSSSTQALARTNITNVNAAPGAHSVSEPRVMHMKISPDGLWLATVDEWVPPVHDFDFLHHSRSEGMEEIYHRREVHLKFWQWEKECSTWELVSRIDKPHHMSSGYGDSGIILDLASDPSSSRFATIGSDGISKTWLPKSRKRDSVLVRGKKNENLQNWNCLHATKLGKLELLDKDGNKSTTPTTGCVSFSEDGSILASAIGCNNGLIYLIDSDSGIIQASYAGFIDNEIFGLEFLGQDLIILSHQFLSFDVVSEKTRHAFQIRSSVADLSVPQKREMMHLAVDHTSRTFAIALPKPTNMTKEQLLGFRSELLVFHLDHLEPQFKDFYHSLITALLPAIGSEGYLVLDSNAEIRTIMRKGTQVASSLALPTWELQMDTIPDESTSADGQGIEDEEKEEDTCQKSPLELTQAVYNDDADDEFPVVTQNQLAEVFDVGPAFALPPIEDLFYQVTSLLTSKALIKTVY